MHFLDLTLPTFVDNLALDEALLLQAEAGGPELLRVWQWPHYVVVLGAGGKIAEDVEEAACHTDEVPVARRSSGGGTVLLGSGCLLFSLVLSYEHHPHFKELNASYRYILHELATALAGLAPKIIPEGISDLTCAGLKFSGNSQQRKRTHFLHHGTLLFDFDLDILARFLKQPARQPPYRRNRAHRSFLMNLPTSAAELTQRLKKRWQALEPLIDWPQGKVRALVEEKYGLEEWVRRR